MGIFDGDWHSKINNEDDGIVTINPLIGSLFSGTHRKTNKGVLGEGIEGDVPHITFVRTHARCTYFYEGDIELVRTGVPHYKIIDGTVTTVCRRLTAVASLLADDWTAEKPT